MIFLHWFGMLLFDICLYSVLFDFAFCYCEQDIPPTPFPSSDCRHIDKLWSFLSSYFTQLVLLLFLVVFQMISCVSWVESLTWQDDDFFFLIVNYSNCTTLNFQHNMKCMDSKYPCVIPHLMVTIFLFLSTRCLYLSWKMSQSCPPRLKVCFYLF